MSHFVTDVHKRLNVHFQVHHVWAHFFLMLSFSVEREKKRQEQVGLGGSIGIKNFFLKVKEYFFFVFFLPQLFIGRYK